MARPFRFLDLAAELRNRVYDEALLHDRSSSHVANTALLQTCRQIHKEAKDIIYAQGTFTIYAESTGCIRRTQPDKPKMALSGDAAGTFVFNTNKTKHQIMQALPPAMLKISKIKVELRVVVEPRLSSGRFHRLDYFRSPADNLLIALARKLNSDGKTHWLEFTLIDKHIYANTPVMANGDFNNVTLLGPQIDLKLKGLDEEVIAYLQALRKELHTAEAFQPRDESHVDRLQCW